MGKKFTVKQVKTGMKKGGDPSPKRVTSQRNKIPSPGGPKMPTPQSPVNSYKPGFIRPTKKG